MDSKNAPPLYDPYSVNDYADEYNSYENVTEYQPQQADNDTFKQRNDPKPLLDRYKLQLLKAFKLKEEVTDPDTGEKRIKYKIKVRKNTTPTASKQGVEDIIAYIEKIINSHVVQGNIDSTVEYRNKMRFISNDVTVHFMNKRKNWEVKIEDIDILISNTINLIDLFLTRTLYNKERELYGVTFKDTTNREIKPMDRPNIFQKVGSFLTGGGGR